MTIWNFLKRDPFYLLLLGFLLFALGRCSYWYYKLSDEKKGVTIAHVFNMDKIRSTRYYSYIYKVEKDFYTASTSGKNVSDLNEENPQVFLLVYSKEDPSIHSLLFNNRIQSLVPLGTEYNKSGVENSAVVNQIFGVGLSLQSNKNDSSEMFRYVSRMKELGKLNSALGSEEKISIANP